MSSSPEHSDPRARRRTGLLTRKLGMTRFFDGEGAHVPVTVLSLDGCQVTAMRTFERNGYDAVQLGAGVRKPKNTPQPQRGQFGKALVEPKRVLREFRVRPDALLDVGVELQADHFLPGQLVDVKGVSIGKGMAGAMKRWNFGGLRASHGVSVSHRSHGSTGQRQDPGKVFKGKKMAGHLGQETVTTQNLQVFRVDVERGLIMVRGSVPGSADGWVEVRDAVKRPAPVNAPFPAAIVRPNTRPDDDVIDKPSERSLVDYLSRMRAAWDKVLGPPMTRRDGVYDLYRVLYALLARGKQPGEHVDDGLALVLENLPATATSLVLDEDGGVQRAGALLLAVLLQGARDDLRLDHQDDWGPELTAAVGRAVREHVQTLPIRFVTREDLKRSSRDGLRIEGRVEVLTLVPGLELDGPIRTAVPRWAKEDAPAAVTLGWTEQGVPLPFSYRTERLALSSSDRARGALVAFRIDARADTDTDPDDMIIRLRPSIADHPLSPLYLPFSDIPPV